MKNKRCMNNFWRFLSASLLGAATIIGGTSPAWAQGPSLGSASGFAVLGGTNVTCTAGSVVGDVGVSPGSAVPFTNTGCTITGATPPATDSAAVAARTDFLNSYAALQLQSASCVSLLGNTLSGQNLAPGVYCLDAVAKTGSLTLTGPSTGVWIFLVDGALTGTDLSVTMTGGGLPCNVFWAPSAAVTLTTSALKGNILAGNATLGSITLTGGSVAGSVLANVAVTMTGSSIIGCDALASPPSSCKGKKQPGQENDQEDDGHDKQHKQHD